MSRQFLVSLSAALVVVLFFSATRASAAKGTVSRKISGCDYFTVETLMGYDLLEWYGGHDPDRGDVLVGQYESYGMHDIYDDTADEELTIWVEDYGLSKEDALDKLVEKCE
jgi:hypothetical protein